MKNRKIFGKKQIVMAGLVVALSAAVWLNMKYASGAGGFLTAGETSSHKNLGDTKYVMTESVLSSAETAAESDAFVEAREERKKAREKAIALLEEAAGKADADKETKAKLTEKITQIAARMEKEVNIETLIRAKGFSDVVVIIGEEDVNVIVKAEELLQSQILQIQDAVATETKISLENIKIVYRK